MEAPSEVKSNLLKKVAGSSIDIAFVEQLEIIKSISLESLLLGKLDNASQSVRQKISQLTSQTISQSIAGNESSENRYVSLLFTANQYLNDAITKSTIKDLIAFLEASAYLRVSISDFVLLNHNQDFKELSLAVFKLLNGMRLGSGVPSDAPYFDHKVFRIHEEGLKEDNLEKQYELILAIERGGRGFHLNYLLKGLIKFSFLINLDEFVNCLNNLQSLQASVFFLHSVPRNSYVTLATSENLNNKWTLIELMRILTKTENQEEPVDLEIRDAVSLCLDKLHKADSNYHMQAISFLQKSRTFNSALGVHLGRVEEDSVTRVFGDALTIVDNTFCLNSKNELLLTMHESLNDELVVECLRMVFEKWVALKEEIRSNPTEYKFDLFLTDYAHFIVTYYAGIKIEVLKKMFLEALDKVLWIDSEWFRTESDQIKGYYLHLSKAYLMSFAFKEEETAFEEAKPKLKEIVSVHGRFQRQSNSEGNPIDLITENLKLA